MQGYTKNSYEGRLAVKSDQPGNLPNWLGHQIFRGSDLRLTPTPVLSNPNKCTTGYYTTRFRDEQIPKNSDWFFPRMSVWPYGDFARINIEPAKRLSNGSVKIMKSNDDWDDSWVDHVGLLYVDCRKSIPSMSRTVLHNITFNEKEFEKLKSIPNQVIYTKKIMVNNSPLPSESEIKFKVETFDNASLKLSHSYASYFHTDEQTYRKWSVDTKASFLNVIGFEAGGGINNEKWKNIVSENSASGSQEIYQASARRELFEFSQKVKIPPFSKSTLIAFSKPIKGNIPFTAIYELFPTGNNNVHVLESTMKHYGMDREVERTNHGTLLVHYDGIMFVDVGHEVDVDIKTVKLGKTFWKSTNQVSMN